MPEFKPPHLVSDETTTANQTVVNQTVVNIITSYLPTPLAPTGDVPSTAKVLEDMNDKMIAAIVGYICFGLASIIVLIELCRKYPALIRITFLLCQYMILCITGPCNIVAQWRNRRARPAYDNVFWLVFFAIYIFLHKLGGWVRILVFAFEVEFFRHFGKMAAKKVFRCLFGYEPRLVLNQQFNIRPN